MIFQCPLIDAQIFVDSFYHYQVRIGVSIGFFVMWVMFNGEEDFFQFHFCADGVRPDENGVMTTVPLINWEV